MQCDGSSGGVISEDEADADAMSQDHGEKTKGPSIGGPGATRLCRRRAGACVTTKARWTRRGNRQGPKSRGDASQRGEDESER